MSASIVAVKTKTYLNTTELLPAKQPRLARIASASENYTAGWSLLYGVGKTRSPGIVMKYSTLLSFLEVL